MTNNTHDNERNIFEFEAPIDYRSLIHYVEIIKKRYPEADVRNSGNSLLGRDIKMLKFGRGPKNVLYIGAHHGMEWITSALLITFVIDFFESFRHGISVGGINLNFLYDSVTFFVIPMLNPDGVEYSLNGTDSENPLYERVIKMNNGSRDFSRWQANARGVDLNHNYDFGFSEYKKIELENGILDGSPTRYSGESPESEPETSSLCALVRTIDFSLIFTLHSQGEEIFYQFDGDKKRKSVYAAAAKRISELCGYRLASPEGMAAYGGFTDWAGGCMGIPSFTLECGIGKNPLPITDCKKIYCKIRQALFSAPLMF